MIRRNVELESHQRIRNERGRRNSLEAGFAEHLVKPVKMESLEPRSIP